MIERWPIISVEQWLAWRKEHVTASTVGALFSCHPYCSALRLYMEKAGVELPEPESSVLRRGRLLESSVAAAVAEQRPDWRLEKCREYFVDTAAKLAATPDYFVHGDPRGLGVLQCKTVAPSVFKREWSETSPPFWIVLQNLTEIMLTDAAFGVVAPLVVDPFDLQCPLYDVPRHRSSEARIRVAVSTFWNDLAAGREPGPDYGLDRDLMPLLAPHERPEATIDLTYDNEAIAGLAERAELMRRIHEQEARCEAIEAMIMHKMRDAAVAIVPDFTVTWKTQERSGYTVPDKKLRVLSIRKKKETDNGRSRRANAA